MGAIGTRSKSAAVALHAGLLMFLMLSPSALATTVSSFGEGPGQSAKPGGIAVDQAAGRLYVADRDNHRLDVFDASTDEFLTAYGWGVLTGAGTPQQCTPVSCRRGVAGSGAGQFAAPAAVAVDAGTGDVYVSGDNRVQKLGPGGEFILMLGKGVNKTTGGNLCTAASADICGEAAVGSGQGEFSSAGPAIAVDSSGVLHAGDEGRVQEFEPSGAFLKQTVLTEGSGLIKSLAVDSTGRIFVGTANGGPSILRLDPAGNPLSSLPTPGEGTPLALAVAPSDELLVAQEGVVSASRPQPPSIARFDSTGTPLSVFGYELLVQASDAGLAFHPGVAGGAFASEESGGNAGEFARVLAVTPPSPGPVVLPTLPPPSSGTCAAKASPIGNSKATLNVCVNPEGVATTTHFEFIDQAGFEVGGFSNPAVQVTPESASIGADFVAHALGTPIGCAEPQTPPQPSCLTPETVYHFRVVAKDSEGHETVGEEATFETAPPLEIEATWTSEVGIGSATLNAAVNALGIPTTGHFEYVSNAEFEAGEFAGASRAPVGEEIDFGNGEEAETGSAEIAGLEADTLYHYRVVVTDSLIAPAEIVGPELTFRTFRAGTGGLPDDRGYELASRAVQESSAELGAILSPAAGAFDRAFALIQEGAPDGDAITYTSFTSFADPQGAPGASQYLSIRGAGGWTTANIVPPGAVTNPLRPPTRGFSPDLGAAAMVVQPDEESFQHLYLQNNGSGELTQLTPEPDQAKSASRGQYCVGYAGSSENGRVIFLANGALTANAPTASDTKFNLYEWSPVGGVRLVSLLPGELPAAAGTENGFGARGPQGCGLGATIVHNAISDDGSRIFWTFVSGAGQRRLLARLDGTQTIQLDARQGGAGSSGSGNFWAASADGSTVYFTDVNRLVPGASAGDPATGLGEGDLYRYDVESRSLTDVTIDPTPGSDPPAVLGVLGASEDGAHVYFVARGVLDAQANANGETAVAGANNLYVVHEDEPPRFIATLTNDDRSDWSSSPREQTARVTPDGRHLAFISTAGLTGFDNTIAEGEGCQIEAEELSGDPHCGEAYLFDAESEELTCASCNPSGERPLGPAVFRFWGSPFEQPRYLSDDGSRLFFDSLDALLPQDTNGRRDVYEFEREGSGSCDAESAGFSPASGGCLFLISTGDDEDASFFLDASADGHDVFLSTRAALLAEDEDARYDVYDARIGGGFAPPAPPSPPCVAETCRGPAPAPPADSNPATGTFAGPGNVKPKPRKPGKKKHRKHKRHRSGAKRSGHGQGDRR